jgi:hypothetical protein
MLHVQIKNAADSEAAGEETSTSGAKGQSDSQHPEVVFSEDGWVTVGKKRREKDKSLNVSVLKKERNEKIKLL